MIYFSIFFFGTIFILVITLLKEYDSLNNYPTNKNISISVIIPFKNEENRILPLINSINEIPSNVHSKLEFILINDYSKDKTKSIIKQQLKRDYKLIDNKKNGGKKWAIDEGIYAASNNQIITLDADVIFPINYFASLIQYSFGDLDIFPVKMTGTKPIEILGSIEFIFLQLITFSSLSKNKALICNGANLAFKKDLYLKTKTHRNDFNTPSGDDVFLLNAFKKENYTITGSNNNSFIVATRAPHSFNQLLLQRKRWAYKLSKLLNIQIILTISILIIYQSTFLFCLYNSLNSSSYLIPILIKFILEISIVYKIKKNKKIIFWVLMHQLWYPFYLFLILVPTHLSASNNWRN